MRALKGWLLASLVLALAAPSASAQVSEMIGACKRNVGVMIACVVVEKAVGKIVEKKAQDWWDYWTSGKGKEAAAPSGAMPAPQGPEAKAIARDGRDYSALMRDFDSLLGSAPRGLSDAQFTDRLSTSCAQGGSRLVCEEFRPLFSGLVTSSDCPTFKDEPSCSVKPSCRWRFGLCVTRAQ